MGTYLTEACTRSHATELVTVPFLGQVKDIEVLRNDEPMRDSLSKAISCY